MRSKKLKQGFISALSVCLVLSSSFNAYALSQEVEIEGVNYILELEGETEAGGELTATFSPSDKVGGMQTVIYTWYIDDMQVYFDWGIEKENSVYTIGEGETGEAYVIVDFAGLDNVNQQLKSNSLFIEKTEGGSTGEGSESGEGEKEEVEYKLELTGIPSAGEELTGFFSPYEKVEGEIYYYWWLNGNVVNTDGLSEQTTYIVQEEDAGKIYIEAQFENYTGEYMTIKSNVLTIEQNNTEEGGSTGEGGSTEEGGNTGESGSTEEGGSTGESGSTEGGNTGEGGSTEEGGNTGEGGSTEEGGSTGEGGSTEEGGNTDEEGSEGGEHETGGEGGTGNTGTGEEGSTGNTDEEGNLGDNTGVSTPSNADKGDTDNTNSNNSSNSNTSNSHSSSSHSSSKSTKSETSEVYKWIYENNKWFWKSNKGNVYKGWLQCPLDSYWYYFDLEDGHMLEGLQVLEGKTYYFQKQEETPSQTYYFENGVWNYRRPAGGTSPWGSMQEL